MIIKTRNLHSLQLRHALSLPHVKTLIVSIALSASCAANTADVGQSALDFLKKVQSEQVDLTTGKDTAISDQTSSSKRKEIEGRLKRMAYDIGQTSLSLGKTKIDGDLAAVMVWKAEGFDPSDMHVFPVAMVLKDGKWSPAPIPASFDNTGVGYDAKSRKRSEALEKWMREQRVYDLQQLRSHAVSRMRKNITKEFDGVNLKSMSGMQAANAFLKACANKNIYQVLGFTGGLFETLPNNWPLRANSVEEAMEADHTPIPWSLLSSPHVLRAVVNHEEDQDNALVSLACLDPSYVEAPKSPPSIQIIHLSLEKSEAGIWQVNLPETFYGQAASYKNAGDPALDRDLFNAFPAKVRALYPATPKKSPEQARDAIISTLQNGTLSELAGLIHIPKANDAARDALVEASQIWWSVRGAHSQDTPPSISMLVPLDLKINSAHATVSCQWFSARKPDRFQIKFLNLSRHEDGWLWDPLMDPPGDIDGWKRLQEEKWKDNWQSQVLGGCPVIESLDNTTAPKEEDAKKLIASWLETCETGDVQKALNHCAVLNLKDSQTTLLRNLGYDMVGAIKRQDRAKVRKVILSDPWAAVGVNSSLGEQPAYPLYPVVSTPNGPKILLEVDLLATGGRGRGFLNRTSIDRLAKFSKDGADSLKELFETYEKLVLDEPK